MTQHTDADIPTAESTPFDWRTDDDWYTWLQTRSVARLATLNRTGAPHLVPVVFVLATDQLWLPVDGKPKRDANLARLNNLKRDSRCSLLFDDYSDDWQALRWLRLDGQGEVLTLSVNEALALTAVLRRKYPQYAAVDPLPAPATAIRFAATRSTGWRASVG